MTILYNSWWLETILSWLPSGKPNLEAENHQFLGKYGKATNYKWWMFHFRVTLPECNHGKSRLVMVHDGYPGRVPVLFGKPALWLHGWVNFHIHWWVGFPGSSMGILRELGFQFSHWNLWIVEIPGPMNHLTLGTIQFWHLFDNLNIHTCRSELQLWALLP